MHELTLQSFFDASRPRADAVIELGGGRGDETKFLCNSAAARVVLIDKQPTPPELPACIEYIEGDYFDPEVVQRVISPNAIDLLVACYTMCFNRREIIEANLPKYFSALREDGVFYLLDFSDKEQVVTRRTNMHDEWFLSMLRRFFGKVDIQTNTVYEAEHGHEHQIMQVICKEKKTDS